MQAYTVYFAGAVRDVAFEEADLAAALGDLPDVALV